jgi:integrase
MSKVTRSFSSSIREAVAAHDSWLSMRRSTGTRAKYAQHLRELEEWASDRLLSELTAHELEFEFLAPWASGKTAATIRNRIAALRSFFDFAERFDLIERNPMRKIEAPARDDEFKGYLSADDDLAVQQAPTSLQERVLVMLLRHTGLRISEACALTWDDVDLDGGRLLADSPALIVRKSKTANGRRTIPIPPILVPILRRWRDRNGGSFVLETKNGTPMSAQFAHRLVVRVGKRAGVKISPHSLRRQYASVALNNGASLHVVSRALGHASTAVTEKAYARLSNDRLAAEILEATA